MVYINYEISENSFPAFCGYRQTWKEKKLKDYFLKSDVAIESNWSIWEYNQVW